MTSFQKRFVFIFLKKFILPALLLLITTPAVANESSLWGGEIPVISGAEVIKGCNPI